MCAPVKKGVHPGQATLPFTEDRQEVRERELRDTYRTAAEAELRQRLTQARMLSQESRRQRQMIEVMWHEWRVDR